MRRKVGLDYSREGIDPMAKKVEDRETEGDVKGGEMASGRRLYIQNKDGFFFFFLNQIL